MTVVTPPPRVGPRRWLICALLFFATTINYADRQVLGLLAPLLQVKIGWDEKQYAYIGTAFLIAYAIGLPLLGRFIDRVGTHTGYATAIAIWSLAAIAHSDLFPRNAVASVVGIGSFGGAIGGALITTFAGFLLQLTHSYVPIFFLVALLVIHSLSPRLQPSAGLGFSY